MNQRTLVLALTLVATLGGLLFGYDTAVISGAIGSINANFVAPLHLAETARSTLSGFTISSALFGCVLGGAIAGWLGNRLGRRTGLMIAAGMFLVGSIGSAWPELGIAPIGSMGAGALVPFNIYRIIGGTGVGISSLLSPLYIAEIAPAEDRGRLVTFQQLAIVIGIILVYFVNYAIASHGNALYLHRLGWRWMFASEAIPALAFLTLLGTVPESPRWLVMRGRLEQADGVLSRLAAQHDARGVLREIQDSLAVPRGALLSFGPAVVLIGILLSIFQQLVGINAVLYYAPLMFRNMGASTNSALLQTVIVGAANLVFTLVAMLSVDRWGRRPLLMTGALIMAGSMLGLGALFDARDLGALSLGLVIVYIAGFALSWGPVVWVLLAEMFPNPIKGRAMAIAVAAQWLANLAVSWSFQVLDGNSALNAVFHHGFPYLLYGAMSVLAALFVWRFVPEPKGMSLEQMQQLWTRPAGAAVRATVRS